MSQQPDRDEPLIAIVGPCASGKSTLANALEAQGYRARQIAQEHSHVPSMWSQITKPDTLIYLDASFEVCTKRKELNWTPHEYQVQVERLADAREKCDLYIQTDKLSSEEVLQAALELLDPHG